MRDIIVHIPVDAPAAPAIDCAASVAALFEAHLDGVVCAYQPINPAIVVGASASYFALPTEYNTDADQAAARLDQFEIAARAGGVSHGKRTISDTPSMANQALTEISRLYDLCVLAQSDHRRPSHYDPLPEAVLFNSGRPILLVPYIHSGPLKTDRMLICWDGSRAAARAVHDAMPLLRRASEISVLAVNEPDDASGGSSSEALVTHLSRHDLSVTAHRLRAEPGNIHSTILSMAADDCSDMLVMGGYGHSRLREFILGGVTRGMFKSLTIPALMSH
jgi:nucleotide-binding universal stress UspA family protein